MGGNGNRKIIERIERKEIMRKKLVERKDEKRKLIMSIGKGEEMERNMIKEGKKEERKKKLGGRE